MGSTEDERAKMQLFRGNCGMSASKTHDINMHKEMIDICVSSPPGLWYHSSVQTALKVNYQAK